MFLGSGRLEPGIALFPVRLFLGVTFVYAGVQKLSDPGFLHRGAPTYIGTQLHGFATGTPGGALLRVFALPHPGLAGVGAALFEIAVGLLVLTGLLTRVAAVGGLLLSLTFFLTASWKTYPYFLGSDIVFVFAWLPLALAGAEGQPAFDHLVEHHSLGRRGLAGRTDLEGLSRRRLLGEALSGIGALTALLGGLSALLRGPYRSGTASLGAGSVAAGPEGATGRGVERAPSLPRNAVRLGDSRRLSSGKAALYSDPVDGSPDILIRHPDGSLTALSATCTHQGCQVGYQAGTIFCPCHGATYNARSGAVEGGPAPRGLARRHVLELDGGIYATPT